MLALCVIGSLLIASATRQYQLDHHLDPYAYLKKHLITFAVGAVLAVLVAGWDFRLVRAYTPDPVRRSRCSGSVGVLVVGSTINGARSWIVLPAGFQLQPSEFAKLALVVGAGAGAGPAAHAREPPGWSRPRAAASCSTLWRWPPHRSGS